MLGCEKKFDAKTKFKKQAYTLPQGQQLKIYRLIQKKHTSKSCETIPFNSSLFTIHEANTGATKRLPAFSARMSLTA
jgi:hypothetical protein